MHGRRAPTLPHRCDDPPGHRRRPCLRPQRNGNDGSPQRHRLSGDAAAGARPSDAVSVGIAVDRRRREAAGQEVLPAHALRQDDAGCLAEALSTARPVGVVFRGGTGMRILHLAILRAAGLLVPGPQRAEWLAEWRSELWYARPSGGPSVRGEPEGPAMLWRDAGGR